MVNWTADNKCLLTVFDRVKPTWQNHKPIAIDVSSNAGYSNLKNLWGKVARCLGLERNAEHSLILERICDRMALHKL